MCEDKLKTLPPQVLSMGQNPKFKIIVNGEEKIFEEGITIFKLLNELNVKPQGIAVELNLEIAPKGKYSETVLKNGDKIEIVRMVGGG